MDFLQAAFEGASTCSPLRRRVGVEVETLFFDESGRPISIEISQALFRKLCVEGWSVTECFNGIIGGISQDYFNLKYDVSANLLELTSPPFMISERTAYFCRIKTLLNQIYRAAAELGANPLFSHFYDGMDSPLIASTPADGLYVKLNGPKSLQQLGHIAAIHYNIDLLSVDEAFRWATPITNYLISKEWPPIESQRYWRAFLNESLAQYEELRFGPSPTNFADYLRALRGMKVIFNASGGEPRLQIPSGYPDEIGDVDFNWFVTFVWWWTRMRVRSGALVFEIRAVPRGSDAEIATVFEEFVSLLNLDPDQSCYVMEPNSLLPLSP